MNLIKTLDIELSGACNYTCAMCPQGDPGREMSFLKNIPWDLFVSVIDQCRDIGLERVRLHGSGEPLLYKRVADAVSYCHKHGLQTLITTNASRLTKQLSHDLINSGLDHLTVSAIGSNREKYLEWMKADCYDLVRDNVSYYNKISDRPAHFYHLITQPDHVEAEISEYKKNWGDHTGGTCEIWHMHNWSGNWPNRIWPRLSREQRSCGRMFEPVMVVRAGGIAQHRGAVVACCMVLGQDSEAVLGHLDEQSVVEIWQGAKYQQLRDAHDQKRWKDIRYCRGCDQLYDQPDSLVYSSHADSRYGRIKFL